jgi:ubiquinone/menaquinone biosynthesis C-methylase UbiE
MNKQLKRAITMFKPVFETVTEIEASIAARWAAAAHKRLFRAQWSIPPAPEHFDHHIDLYAFWKEKRASYWVERGVFGALALKRGGNALELACGDGFNTRNFYSPHLREIVACDFDPSAIKTATKKNSAPNIRFELADIRTSMPAGKFDTVIWDAAIEHFTPAEIDGIMTELKRRLQPGGILTGYTLIARANGELSLEHHEYEFHSKKELFELLTRYFKNVSVFETRHPERDNLYFWASDATIPFGPGWPDGISRLS